MNQPNEPIRTSSTLATILRYLGSISLVVAAGTFLFQKWDLFGHTHRYLYFLGFTSLLATLGFLLKRAWQDDPGSRAIAGLLAAFVPVHFCVWGGFIHSRLIPPDPSMLYPPYVRWIAESNFDAGLMTLIGLAVLLPVTFGAFRSLLMFSSGSAAGLFLLLNGSLLLPIRSPDIVGLVSLGVLVLTLAGDHLLLTGRGWIRVLLYAPYAALIARTVSLYHITDLFVATLWAAGAFLIYVLVPRWFEESEAAAIQALSVIPAMVGWYEIYRVLHSTFQFDPRLELPILCLPFAFILFAMGRYALDHRRHYRNLACLVASYGMIMNVLMTSSLLAALGTLTAGIGFVVYGTYSEMKLPAALGFLGFVVGISVYFIQAIKFATLSPWISLAVVGVLTIVAAAVIDRRLPVLRSKFDQVKSRIRTWK